VSLASLVVNTDGYTELKNAIGAIEMEFRPAAGSCPRRGQAPMMNSRNNVAPADHILRAFGFQSCMAGGNELIK